MASSYKRIASVTTAADVLKFLADQKTPVSGPEVGRALNVPNGTIMCHLVTLEDAGLAGRVGDHWELGQGAALLWARKKASLQGRVNRTTQELNQLED